jgi:hypothetical protein
MDRTGIVSKPPARTAQAEKPSPQGADATAAIARTALASLSTAFTRFPPSLWSAAAAEEFDLVHSCPAYRSSPVLGLDDEP